MVYYGPVVVPLTWLEVAASHTLSLLSESVIQTTVTASMFADKLQNNWESPVCTKEALF